MIVSLTKDSTRYTITCDYGDEAKALDQLIEWVNDKNLNFDWLSAGVMANQIAKELAKELKSYVPSHYNL